MERVDVVIVGAGLSGIGAAYHLQSKCPDKSFTILEGRERLGGTWDLFQYPGIRSDSDMYTLGYSFKPWTDAKAIADGPAILKYIRETAEEYGIDRRIRYQHRVERASWSSADAVWTLEVRLGSGELVRMQCRFLFMCAGYYKYEEGYTPDFPGMGRFGGAIVHPQTDRIEYEGKRVVVIGSGATAVTLVPKMAQKAEHVTMLQRSPTYIVSLPAEDAIANRLREKLPPKLAYGLVRWRNVVMGMLFFQLSRRRPEQVKRWIIQNVRAALGKDYDVETHFTPSYNPWDQRVCLVPDGDLFEAIKSGQASVVTDHVETFTETGLKLRSGEELEADVVVTATGFHLQFVGGAAIEVDGKQQHPSELLSYKGLMFSGVPNFAIAVGYTNASWTLKADLTCELVCRILNAMDKKGADYCVPHADASVEAEPILGLTSGYIQRAMGEFPNQGSKWPWRVYQNYLLDLIAFRYAPLNDGVLKFENAAPRRAERASSAEAVV